MVTKIARSTSKESSGGNAGKVDWAENKEYEITNIIEFSYSYFGLVLGCIDADLCK